MTASTINLTLKVWRQGRSDKKGRFETYPANNISTDMSFLEMLDVVNEELTKKNIEPIAFDHDCREGICGMCGAVVNGRPHGHESETTLCQLHMRHFEDGDTIVIEPWRARAFKQVKDLVVDRSSLDQIIQAGGYISVNTGGAPDANTIPIPRTPRMRHLMRRHASAAGPVWPPARMRRPCCLSAQRSRSLRFCHRDDRKRPSGSAPWSGKWMSWGLTTAPTRPSARWNARKGSPFEKLPV